MQKGVRNILIGTGIAISGIAVAGAISHTATWYLVKVALDREIPKKIKTTKKSRNRLRGFADMEAFTENLIAAEERLEKRESETVEMESFDGEGLVGHWYPCQNAERVIVAMHGWRSSWARDFGSIADFWHDNDCSILFAEQRGQGNSGGDYMGFGLIERYDCREWVNWVNAVKGRNLPIYLAGVSMGATTVLMASVLDMPENVHGILADCGFTSPHAIWKHVVENNLHMSYGLRGRIADDMCRKKIRMSAKAYSAADAMRENKIPVLFVHGTDDHFVPVEMTYENYKACIAPKRLLIVPGADHGMSYFVDREGYEWTTLKFWNDYDSKNIPG